jgi:hypothetical protein
MGDPADGIHVGPAVALREKGLRIAVIEMGPSALVLAQGLAARGEGPHAVVLRTNDATPNRGALDLALAHGAPIEFER